MCWFRAGYMLGLSEPCYLLDVAFFCDLFALDTLVGYTNSKARSLRLTLEGYARKTDFAKNAGNRIGRGEVINPAGRHVAGESLVDAEVPEQILSRD